MIPDPFHLNYNLYHTDNTSTGVPNLRKRIHQYVHIDRNMANGDHGCVQVPRNLPPVQGPTSDRLVFRILSRNFSGPLSQMLSHI